MPVVRRNGLRFYEDLQLQSKKIRRAIALRSPNTNTDWFDLSNPSPDDEIKIATIMLFNEVCGGAK